MIDSIVSRVGGALLTLLLAVAIAFLLVRATGDPVRQMLGPMASDEAVAAVQAELGLDEPFPIQFGSFLSDMARGDLGESLRYGRPNLDLIVSRLPATLQLAGVALLIAVLIGLPMGMVAALNAGSMLDKAISGAALVAQSTPLFWLGLVLIGLFAVSLRILPAGGSGGLEHLIMPAITLSSYLAAQIARLTRMSMISVLREPYIGLAQAYGIGSLRLAFVHALRNAALPVVTLIGLQMGFLLSGAVTVEFVFAWPGVGNLMREAVVARDFTLVQAIVILAAAAFVVVNLSVDLLYVLIDPRIRTKRHG